MNKILFALVAIALVGVGIFLFRKYNKVKPTNISGYIDVNGNIDKGRDTNGNNIDTTKENTDSNTYLNPLSFKSATELVDKLKVNV